MAGIEDRLTGCPLIGLDTAVFIYHFENHPKYLPLTRLVFSGIERGRWHGAASVLTLMEICVRPLSLGRGDVARKYEALLVNFPNLAMIDVDRDVARIAARLRAKYGLRPPDALHIGSCLAAGAQAFVTNDLQLKQVQELDVVVLEDWVGDS